MSVLNKLTEGIVRHDVRKETHALVRKWEKTGLLEGITSQHKRDTMVRLLENQARLLLKEQSSLAAGDVEGFAAVAFPLVRRVFAGLIANDLVSVQAMNNSVGLIFFLDFVYSTNLGESGTTTGRMGNAADKSIYGTDQVGSEVTGGVNLVGSTNKEDLSGPRTTVGYAYGSPTGSNYQAISHGLANSAVTATFKLDGSVSEALKKLIDYDPDLLAVTDLGCFIIDVAVGELETAAGKLDLDLDNLGAVNFSVTSNFLTMINDDSRIGTIGDVAEIKQIRRLTQRVAAADAGTSVEAVRFVFTCSDQSDISTENATAEATSGATIDINSIEFPIIDGFTAGGGLGSLVGTSSWNLEAQEEIPEIDIKIDSIEVRAQTKKLKAKWTQELGQDLSAWHNVDAEVELTSVLAEHVALEIDREILADLIRGATAQTIYWSRSPGLFVNRTTGSEIGASAAAPDFTGTVSEWYQTLIESINDVSAQIHRKTLRGGANFVVCSPEVANILEFTSAFRASVTADAESGYLGVEKIGALNRKMDVIVDPYFPRQVVLVGRRGKAFLESGYVYAPYVPLQTFPTIPHPEDFTPRMGVMTRYAKKMIRPDMYGLVIVRGLLGESGATS
jgi:hypothetical protein